MKNLKKIIGVILVMCFVICCTGCIKMDVGVELKEDGKASMTVKMSLAEDLYEMMLESEDEATEGEPEEDADSVDLAKFEKEVIDGDTYYSYSETQEFESYDSLITELQKLEVTDEVPVFNAVTIAGQEDGVYTFDVTTSKIDENSMGEMSLPDGWFSLTMTVKMPGEIQEFMNGEKLEDGSVRFSLTDFSEKQMIYISSKVEQSNNLKYIVIWTVGLAAIAVVLYIRFKPKKNTGEGENITEEEKETPSTEECDPSENDVEKE